MTDLIKRESTALSTGGNKAIGYGFENIDMTTVSMPRAKVMQGLSPELQDPDYNFKQGDIIHGLLMEKLSDTFIPIMFWDSKVMFVPRNASDKKEFFETLGIEPTENMFVCKASDGRFPEMSLIGKTSCADCIYAKFGWDGDPSTPPLCTNSINALALFDGQEMPVVVQFSNTNYKYGRKFRDMAVFSGGAAFSKKYKITSKLEQNEQGRFYTTPVKPAGKTTPEEYDKAFEMYKQFSGVRIDVDADTIDSEAVNNDF
jgi:hypothetical protein